MQPQNQMNSFNQINQTPVQNNMPVQNNAPKQKSKYKPTIIILAIVTAAGLGFGGFELWQNIKKDEEVKNLQAENNSLKEQEITQTIEEDLAEIVEENTIDTTDYIYIGEWGIKIKKPEGIYNVGYIFQPLTSNGEKGSVYITGTLTNINYLDNATSFPKHAQTYTGSSLGVLSRHLEGEYSSECKTSCGKLVATIDGYEYIYAHPQACYSENGEVCANEEVPIAESIEKTLTDPSNISKF